MWNRIKLMFSSIFAWVLPLLKALSTNVGKVVLKEAVSVCGNIATTMLAADGTQKKKEAFEQIVLNLRKQGLTDLSDSMINAAIETAVQFLKAKE